MVGGRGVFGPEAVDLRGFSQRCVEVECNWVLDLAVALGRAGIPALEGIAGTDGVFGHGGRLTGLTIYIRSENGLGEGRVAQVGIKSYPVAGIDGRLQNDVGGKIELSAVLVDSVIAHLRAELLPAAELARRAGHWVVRDFGGIGQVDGVLMRRRIVCAVENLIVFDRDTVLVPICNDVGVERHSVIIYRGSVLNTACYVQSGFNVITNVLDCHCRGRLGCIVLDRRPALEECALGRAGAGVEDVLLDLVKLALVNLHGDRSAISVGSMEVYRLAGVVALAHDNINREVLGSNCNLVGSHRG